MSNTVDLPTWHRPIDPDGAFVDGPAPLGGGGSGPLGGVLLAVKDLFDVAGRVTGAGNPVLARRWGPARSTATAVTRLVEAGAVVVGRTVTDELAYSLSGTNVHLGTPRNPAAPGCEPGGSSSGSAVAVAAGVADLALGTDTGGSIRVPASYCRLLGWRPTHGLVPMDGVVPLSPSLDTVGLFARPDDADVLRVAASALAGGLAEAGACRRLLLADDLLALLDPSARRVIVQAAERLAGALDVELARAPVLPCLPAEAAGTFRTVQGAEAWRVHGELVSSGQLGLGPGIAARFRTAAAVTADDEAAAGERRAAIAAALAGATADGTLLVQAAAAGAPPRLDTVGAAKAARRLATLALTAPASLAGVPVAVLPARTTGPPLGLAIVGGAGQDALVLDALATGVR